MARPSNLPFTALLLLAAGWVLTSACSRGSSQEPERTPRTQTAPATADAGTPVAGDVTPPPRGRTGQVVLGMADGGVPDGGVQGPSFEGTLREGRREGVWTHWYGPGRKAAEVSFQKGSRHGPFTLFWPDGAVAATGSYANGQLDTLTHEDTWSLAPVVRASVTVGEPLVALHTACDVVAAVTAKNQLLAIGEDASVRWRAQLEAPLASGIVARELEVLGKGSGCVLQVHQQDGSLRFLDAKTGEEKLRSGAVLHGPFLLGGSASGGLEVVSVEGREVRALAFDDGAPRWSWTAPADLTTNLTWVGRDDCVVADRTGQLWRVSHGSAKPFEPTFSRPVTALLRGEPLTVVTRGDDGFHLERLDASNRPGFSSPAIAAEPQPVRSDWGNGLFLAGDRLLNDEGRSMSETLLSGPPPSSALAMEFNKVVLLFAADGSLTVLKEPGGSATTHGPWRGGPGPDCKTGVLAVQSPWVMRRPFGGTRGELVLACAGGDRVHLLPLSAVIDGRKEKESNVRWTCEDCADAFDRIVASAEGLVYGIDAHSTLCAHDLFSGARAFCAGRSVTSPLVQDGVLYFLTTSAVDPWRVHALGATTGDPLWSSDELRPERAISTYTHYGPVVTPRGTLLTAVGHQLRDRDEVQLRAFDALTGRPRFERTFSTHTRQADAAVAVVGDVILTLEQQSIQLLDPVTGEVRGSVPLQGAERMISERSTAFVLGSREVLALSTNTGKAIWRWRLKDDTVEWSDFQVRDGRVYLDGSRYDGTAGRDVQSLVLDARTGRPSPTPEGPSTAHGDPPSCRSKWLDPLLGVAREDHRLLGLDLRREPCQPKRPEP